MTHLKERAPFEEIIAVKYYICILSKVMREESM